MSYPVKMKKGIKGPAWVIVPISESLVDRAVFNGVARKILGKEMVETQEEFDRVAQIKFDSEEQIIAILEDGPLCHSPPTVDECIAIENFVYENYEVSKDE